MKKIKLLAVLMLCPIMLLGQLEKTADGRVGIGTTNPVTALDVRGDVFIPHERSFWIGATRDSGNRLRMTFNNYLATHIGAYIDYHPNLFIRANWSIIATFNSNGYLGLGNGHINPQHRLDVIGNIRTSGRILFRYSNIVIGNNALRNNTTGHLNTVVGEWALSRNTTGSFNTAVGWGALHSNTTGQNNTAIGSGALHNNTTGRGNTAIGDMAGVSSGNLQNATARAYARKIIF